MLLPADEAGISPCKTDDRKEFSFAENSEGPSLPTSLMREAAVEFPAFSAVLGVTEHNLLYYFSPSS